jgi:hypothetical protein
MAKFRPRGARKKTPAKSMRGLFPCLVVLIGGMAVIFFCFYELMTAGK